MSLDGNIQLINQICAKSGLKGKDLENLRTNLSNLSKQELQAELLKFLVSSDTNNSNKGLQVEQASSDVLLENYQKTYYYDKKGNVITEYKDGDNVLERIIQGKDDAGNDIEITVTYRNNRPFTKVVKKNGEKEETVSYTYHDKSDTNFIPSVTVETTKADNTVIKSEVLAINGYDGDFDLSKVIERETTLPDGTVTALTKILNILVETAKRPDGTTLTTYYNGTDITACDNNQLRKLRQSIKRQGQDPQELYFDGEGNTIVTVNAGDGWERLARRFHTTEKKLKELNPKIKNLKAGQDILIPKEFDIESKEIGRVQPRDEAIVQAWNAEVDRQIAQKVTENISKEDANELKKAGVNPSVENYIFYQKFSELNPSVKQNVLSMIKYYKAQGVKDLNAIKAKILETYPDVNLFDSGKLIKFFRDSNTGIPYFNRYNKQSGQPVSVETFVTDYLKLNLKTEPGKTVYERLASISQENLDKLNASQLSDMSKLNFEAIAAKFLNAGLNIMTKSEYQIAINQARHSTSAESETQIKDKTVYFAYKMVHQAKENLEAHLAELKDHYVKNFGEIVWEGLKVIPSVLLPKGMTSGSGQYEAIVKNIHHKISELDKLESDLLVLRGKVNSSDFEAQYKKLLKTDYNPEKIQTLMALSQNQPDKNSPDYAVYEKQMESAIKDVTGKDFTKNVSSFINWSKGAGSLVETAIFCYVTAGMGSVVTIGGKTARAVTVMGKTFTTATQSGAAMVMATNFGRYAAVRAGLNFIDDIDNLCAPMNLEEMLRGRKDITLGGMFVGEHNADQIRESLSAVKNWATGKITRDEAEAIIKKNFKSLSFDDFVSSNGGQWVLNTATSSIFGLAAGYASPLFFKAGEVGTKWGQKLGLEAPTIQKVTADLLAKNPAGINAAEFMAKTYEALHATNIVGKGLQFLVETAVFYCTNLPLSLIQEKLSESNGELEKAIEEGRLGSYLISRFGEEALNLLKVKSIGTIIAMMMGTTNVAQLKENFEDYDVLKNTTIRYEDATIQNPDGTYTSGKAVVLEGPSGKLYVDGGSAKFYTAQGQLVVNENLGAEAQFMNMNEGVKTTFLLGKFMQIERYVKSLQNPVEDAVDLSMPYKPSSQEQQVQSAINQIAGQHNQQPLTAPQTVINPAVNQPAENETGAVAVEIPINQPLKNPYEKPAMTVIDMTPQQMVASSSPQQTAGQQVSIPAAPLTDEQKTELHERMQKITQAYSAVNYAGIDVLSNLTEDERKEFVDNVLHLGSGKVYDDYDFLFFANGEKPAVLLGGMSETPEPCLDKLKSDNIDVFHRVVTFGNGQKRNNTLLINKQAAKRIIGENKELFQKRLGLSENTTVDEIYEKLLSDDSILKDHEESSDLTGLILGYPKYNTMIFRLDKWIVDHNIMTNVEMRRNPDIEKYKSALKQALQADDSPYKNMSEEFKNTLLAKINEITELVPSRELFNNDSDGYVFNYTTPEPKELVRIEQSMSQTADNITTKNKYLTMSYSEVAEAINARLQSPQNISDLMDLFNALKEKSPRNVRKISGGSASFYDPETKKNYNLIYDRFGNIIKYTVTVGWNESDYYIYDKNGKLTKVNETDYYKVKTDFARDDELLDYILTHPELMPAETRRLILQDEYHTFSREDIDELSSLMKTQDDIDIVNKLLSTKGNESKYIRAIGDALKLSAQKFGVKDIIKVLKSDKAKAYVLNHIKTDSYAKKTELEPLLENQKFEKIVTHDFNDEVDLSYRTKDITLDVICTDLPSEYLSNSGIREQIDAQVPIGEAACINGEMYCRTEDGLVPIKLSKETFDKLFPVDQRYNIKQGRIGDCWFIAELGGYMASPNGRATIYSLFRQDGDDIYIKLPSNPNIEIKFENGDLNKLFPISLYKHNGSWKFGKGDAHVQACKGLQMIEQALSFVRDNYTDEETTITANDKFLMNKQMQRLEGSHIGGGGGTRYLGNDEVIGYYTSIGIVLNGANSVEEILDILADGVAKSDNVFGSVSFHDDVSIDVNEEIVSGHQYRIVGYDKETGIVKMVDPTVANKYMDIPIEYFKKARPNVSVYKIGSGIKGNEEVTTVSGASEQGPIADNSNNLTPINTPQELGQRAMRVLANSKHRIATAGYSQNPPEGYEETAITFLSELENKLGDSNTAYVTSPTTQKGSIDAVTTEVEGLGDNSIFYTTAQDYISYIGSDNPAIDTQALQQVPKYVLPDAKSYSQATAAASNTFIAIGGKNTTVSDFVNAVKHGNKSVILDSAKIDTPAWDSENGTVGNASRYIAEQINAVQNGKPLPYPEVGEFTRQFIEENLDKFDNIVKIITTNGEPSSLRIAASQAAEFLNEDIVQPLNSPENDIQKQKPIEEIEQEFLDMLSDSEKPRWEKAINGIEQYKNSSYEEKVQAISFWLNQAKLTGLLKDNYVPELGTVQQKLEFIEDTKIRSYIESELNKLNTLPEAARTEKLLELDYLADAINNLNGHYSMIHTPSSLLDSPVAQAHRIQAINNNSGGELNYSPEAQARIDEHIKYDGIKNFIAKYADSNPEMAEYLYTQYCNTLSPEVSAKCDEISKKTGVKIFVDNTDTELVKHLKEIQDEYTLWKNAGLKVPNILDEFDVSILFVLPELQGQGVPVAFTKPELNWQAISICNMNDQGLDVRSMLRHELTHLNDPNFNDTIWDENNPIHNEILTNREKYAQYLKDAGADDNMVEYAFSMPREFSAVAMQLDTSKYPDEFKTLLAKMGVPKKALDFEPVTSNLPKENDTTVKQQGSEVKPESAVQISQDKPDWASFKTDRAKVTQVLLSQVEDKAAFEKFKVSKNYETDEEAVIPFIKQLRRNDENFKLSESAKEIINNFVKKYDKSGFMPDAEFDLDYLNNYHRTSHIYNSKHEMAYHDLTQRIFDVRRKFDLDKDENFDLEKLHDKLEALPTETLEDLRRMFNEYEIKSKEDALRILNSDFSKSDIEAVKSMLEDNDCFSYFALADFVFSTPEEFAIKQQRLIARKDDLPSNCDYDSQKKAWTEIINMSDENYNYYHSMQDDYPEGLDIKELPLYRKLMAEAPEFTKQLMGMKKKAHIFFGNDVPRFTMEEISKLYEASKTNKELIIELINKQKDKGGLSTGYVYNDADDIIKIAELTKTYGREGLKELLESENSYSPDQIEILLSLKAENPELYEIFIKNGYSASWLKELKECIAKNPALTNELMQNKEYSISDIKSLVDCDEKHPEITKYLFEKVEEGNGQNDRFTKSDKTRYAEYVLNCTEEQLKFFMECLEARNPDGRYRFSYNIKDICKLHEEHPQELQELLDYRFKDKHSDEEKCLYEGVITVFMPCYLEDKATALEAIKVNPSMSVYSMRDLYNMLRSPDRNEVYELLNIKKTDDENTRRFDVEDIKNLLPLKKQNPAEFERLLNTKALQNGKVVDAYDADFIKTYMGTPHNVVKHLMNITVKDKDGNEYKMLTGAQIAKIHEVYADSASDKALLDEIIHIPKYKAILPVLGFNTMPVFCNRKVLDLLDKNGIENATSVVLSPVVDGKFMLLIKFDKTTKTINMSIDNDKNVTVLSGDETSYKRDDKNIIRRNFEDGSYLVEEISYVDALNGDGGKTKLAYSKKKTWYDSNGVQTRSEVVTPVDGAPGEFTINVYERGLDQQMNKKTVGSVKITEDDEGQTLKVEKTLISPDGAVTRQTKTTDPNGSSSTYEITAVENGETKVLFSQKRGHVRLDENHYTSSLDGQIYDMKFSNDGVTVSKLDDEGKPFETITLGTDVLDTQLMGLFKQLPGDTFFLIHKIGLNRIYLDESVQNNAQYLNQNNTIRISRELMNDPFVFMHELHHAVSFNMFNGVADNKDFSDTYNSDLDNYQKISANQEEHIAGYFSSKYHGTVQGKEEAFAEIGAIASGLDVSVAANETLGMRSLVVQQNMARLIATEMNMIKDGMSKPLPPRKEIPSFTMARISEAPQTAGQTLSDAQPDVKADVPEMPASAILSKSEFMEKLSIINKYIDEFDPEDDPEIEVLDDMESFGNSAYEIYKQDPEIFNMIFEGKDFNGNPILEKTSVYLMIAAFALKTVKNTSQLRNIVVLLSLYENTDTMKYSPSLGISETDFNLLVAIEKDRSDVQGDWKFESGVPAGFNEIYETLIKDMNDVQKRTLTIMLQEGAVSYTDLPELNRRFMTIKTEQDAEEFGKLFKEILPKNDIRPRAVTLLVDKITSPEMKVLADKLLDLFENDLPASSTRLVTIMEAAHLGAYERIAELLENPTKENKEEIRKFGCAVDKSKEKVKLIAQSGILKDRRFYAEQLDNIRLEQLYHIIERDLLSSEKNYSAMDILHLADSNDKTYNQIVKYDLMKDFTAFDAKSIVENIDDIKEYDLLKYRKILTGKTMTDLCYFPELRNDFINNPQIQKLGPLGADAMNEIINGASSEQTKRMHDFGRELCDDVQAGKLNKYDCNELYLSVETENLDFVRELYQNMAKYHLSIDELIEIAKVTVLKEIIPIARRMVEDPNFPNSLIRPVLRCADEDNMDILEKTCFDPEFPKEYIRDILNFASQDKNNAKAVNGLLDNPELKQWFIMNLKNDLTPDLIVNLARTQKKLNTEAQQSRVRRSDAPQSQEAKGAEAEEAKPQDVQDAIDKMVKLGMDKNMAEKAYIKLCQDKGGNIDKVKLNAVLALVEAFGINKYTNDKGKLRTNPNISPKEIQEIFEFSVGSALSSANGQFRPDVVKDIIRLRQAGVTDVKLATTLSCVKNMGLIEMKDRFNTKVREDAVKRAEELPEDVKSSIENAGFDLTAVLEKASAEAKGGKVKRVNLESVTLRSLDDIYGDEKILISKHKSDKDFNQKIWGDPDKFKEWAEKRVADLMDFEKNPNYTTTFGDAKSINAERKQRLQEWYDYLTKESDYKDNPFVHCLILEEITKELRSDNAATIKPVSPALFNEVHGILIDENNDMSFDTLYSQKMREKAISLYSHGTQTVDGIEGQWVTIPQTQKGDPNYDEHVAMVQSLAEGSSWCLRASNANNYIQSGNIHYFIDKDGKAQVAMHEENGEITQIQKRYKQDSSVPVPYVEVIEQYYKDNNLHGLKSAIQAAKDAKPNFEKLKAEVTKLMEQEDYLAVFDALEFKVKVKDDGTYVLNKYDPQITTQFTIADLGIDEDKLMANVSEIEHDMNLDGSNLTEMKKLVKVGGVIKFGDNKISDVRNLEKVKGQKISWIRPHQTPPEPQKTTPDIPEGLTQISLNLTPKQVDIYSLLQRDLKNFGDFDDALQIKIVKVIDKYSSPSYKQLSDLFKAILAYAGEPDLIEKICDNDMLLSEINKNAQTVVKLFAHHKNIDKDIRNKVYFNLLLMRYFYPENYSNLTHSKGYQQIMTGGLSVGVLQNLKYNDNIDEDYFYNLFDNLEKGADNTVAQSDVLKQYPENHIKTATELDPSRQDEILNLIKNAPDQTLMAKVLSAVNVANANINKNVDAAKKIGNYVNPAEVTRERNLLIELIKMASENSDIVGTISKLGLSSRESSILSARILKVKFDEKTQDKLLTLLSEYAVVFNMQYALNVIDFVQKAPEKIDFVRKIITKGDTYWLSFVSENNADYIEDKMDNTEFGSITFMQTLMLTLVKNMPEMKDKNNWQHIEDCANILLEDVMNEYMSGYDKISDEFNQKVAAEPEHKGRFIYRKNVAINLLRASIRDKIKFMSGVLDMYVNSPEKFEQVKNSGYLDMIKQGKLHPASATLLNRNSNISDNLYSDLEAVQSGKSIVPEFPEGTPLEKVFRETKTGDAVEVGSKMYINDGKELVEWQMTKDAFLKLFPPVERFVTLQGNLGDCYLVSSMTSMMNTPEGRAELYKSFKLEGHDVVVTIKGYEDFKGSTTFPNGNITVDKAHKHVIGCPGMIMFEQAYAKVSLREPYFDFLPSLDETTTPFSLMQRVQSGYSNEAMSELLGLKNLGKLSIEAPYSAPRKSVVMLNIINPELNANKVKAYLTYYAGRKNFILQFGTLPKGKETVESSILPEYNLVSSHGYNIVGYDSETEIVKITNPHNASVVTEIPLSKLLKYMQALIVTDLNE